MLQPKITKYRKQFKLPIKGNARSGATIAFGEFGLKALEHDRITSRQIESARRAMTNFTKRAGKIWIRIFPHRPITIHPAETDMGSGKGSVDHYAAAVKPGHILFEIGGLDEKLARKALTLAKYKLPIKTKIVVRGSI